MDDLVAVVDVDPSDFEVAAAYLRREAKRILRRLPLPAAGTYLTLAQEFAARSAYIPVPFEQKGATGSAEPTEDPVAHVTNGLNSGQSLMLLGEPGTGKSYALELAFLSLADDFLAKREGAALPVLVHLASWARENATVFPGPLGDLSSRAKTQLASGGLVYLLDGLDELPTTRVGPTDDTRTDDLDLLLDHPAILSCRSSFHDLKVKGSSLERQFDRQLSLLKLDPAIHAPRYVELYTTAMGRADLAPNIVETLSATPRLLGALTRPLLLSMAVSVLFIDFANESRDTSHVDSNRIAVDWGKTEFAVTGIYRSFMENWLAREIHRGTDAVGDLSEFDKLAILERLAWAVFASSGALRGSYGSFRLADLMVSESTLRRVVNEWCEADDIAIRDLESSRVLQEVRERTFLLRSADGGGYHFAHKSFFEYLLASYVFHRLSADIVVAETDTLLAIPLPDEVIDFLRELLRWSLRDDSVGAGALTHIRQNLLRCVRESAAPSLMPKQQAANLLPIVADNAVRAALRETARTQHPFILRAVAVGEALEHRSPELLDEFVSSLRVSPVGASFHMGYNLIYYGDQPLVDDTFRDGGGVECDSFFRNCLTHLGLTDAGRAATIYHPLRAQALASVGLMLEDPLRAERLLLHSRADLVRVRKLCSESKQDQSEEYERQRLMLGDLLDAILGLTH